MDASSSPVENNHENGNLYIFVSIISFLIALGSIAVMGCICCKRRRNQKSELAGIEGIVKLKQLDDSNVSIDTTDYTSESLRTKNKLTTKNKNATLPLDAFKASNGFQDYELKRSSAAPHRSLPDIPAAIAETGGGGVGDNNSELYATVGDKLQEKESTEKNTSTTNKLANISQHSSMSQADDVSSPYARVKSPHAYDKVKKSKHPYAQVIQPATAGGVAQVENIDDEDEEDEDETTIENPISHRESSNNDLLSTAESHLDASAAISGRISASQELPYMTPPIMNIIQQHQTQPPQHFSGDSQDSSKGYTSISVREPLANIIAQTNQQRRRREMQDSHYATVSDDSDEMYAAIEDPNSAGVDLYTSGSETYAQIQAPMTVSVEINASAPPQPSATISIASQTPTIQSRTNGGRPVSHHEGEVISQIETLKSIHSRQASSSSCTSSVGNNIGSPKPEKRQANSPLPPTPQSKAKDSNNNKTRQEVEGMYAKVMKKTKLSSVTFENSSPVLNRHEIDAVDGIQELKTANEYETIDKKRNRARNNETADVGYETIPADRNNNKDQAIAALPHYAQIGEKKKSSKTENNEEENLSLTNEEDPKYETLKLTDNLQQKQNDSDYDPNYEIVVNKNQRVSSSSSTSSTLIDDGYSQIGKKQMSSLKDYSDEESIPGYSTIKKPEHNYSSIGESLVNNLKITDELDTELNIYSSIPAVMPAVVSPSTDSNSNSSEMQHLDYEEITSNSVTPTTTNANNNYETLSISESSLTTTDEPTLRYQKENPYERLHNEKGSSPDIEMTLSGSSSSEKPVDDFFKV